MSTNQPTPSASPSSTATSHEPKGRPHAWIPLTASIGGLVILALAGLTIFAYITQAKTIVRSSRVAGQDVSGLTTLEAIHRVQQQWSAFTASAYHFQLNGQDYAVSTTAAAPNPDEVALDLTSLNITAAINQAYDFGHTGPRWTQARQRLSGWLGRHHDFGHVGFAKGTVADALHQQTKPLDSGPVNAGLTITNGQVTALTPSSDGQSIDYTRAVAEAVARAKNLDTTPIQLTVKALHPAIVSSPALLTLAQQQAPPLLARAPFTLTNGDAKWMISATKLATLLGFSIDSQGQPRVGFDTIKTAAYLNSIGKDVNVAAQNAKLTIASGEVSEFQRSIVGQTLNVDQTIAAMEQALITQGQNTAALVIDQTQPATSTLSQNNLGITEMVSEATTNFRRSPTNRRFNIGLGAKLLNGILIAPGETFSLVKALGPIDKDHGWRPELVILGSDITPEFGGGLCQVATTMFRTALNAGLPITERHNHSLRISYYEPPVGLDATIYEPQPDLRFTNDYGHYLLLQTEVNGDNLTFRFFGTKDGRSVDIPTPTVFNRTPIPAPKNIEVTDLKPGQKECQTPGHPGADAIATYTVTKADGTKVTQTFKSHYRALGVICRIGQAAPKPAPTTNTNTSVPATNTNTAANTNAADTTITTQ